jgi:carotenoid cleavage dioxygenase
VYTIDKDGKKTEEAWYKAPFCGMIHDCALTKNWVILPMTPLECKLDRLKKGGNHWAWNPKLDQCYGVVPRRGGKPEDIRWFRSDNAFHGHVAGAYESDDGHIIMDLTVADGNVFFFFRTHPPLILLIVAPEEEEGAAGSVAARNKLTSPMTRWKFNPKDKTDTRYKPHMTMPTSGEFARIDDRFVTKYYKHFFLCVVDTTKPYDFAKCGPPTGGLFNCLGHFNWETGKQDIWFAGPTSTVQEPVFIPRSKDAEEGDGYLLGLVNRLDEMRNDLVVLDTKLGFEQGPIAVIRLPFKLRVGLHGNFVPYDEIEAWRERTGDNKKFEMRKMPSPRTEETNGTNGVNGVNGY